MSFQPVSSMLVAVALASAAAAQAHTLSLSNISAQWFDGTPAANVTYANNPSAAPSARWGTSPTPGGPASGFDFTVAGQPINFVIPPSPSAIQSIGTFTHLNFPIYDGTEITSIKFAISADVMVDSMSVGTRTFNYAFDMFETVNSDDPCADGGTLGAGINANGCADRVTAHWLPTSEDFLVGTEVFTLNLLGFSLDMAGTNPFMAFWTAENQSNSAFLLANVALRNGIPEPATLPLLGLGLSLAGLAMARRQRRLASAAGSAP